MSEVMMFEEWVRREKCYSYYMQLRLVRMFKVISSFRIVGQKEKVGQEIEFNGKKKQSEVRLLC